FVVLLAAAWRWGLPADEVAALVPAAEHALDWLATYGDPDGDGFIEYVPTGAGLTNQGWKDSHDGIQHADGRIAVPPLALAEVQAYAYRAARDGADLLDAFGRLGGERWRAWADNLAERFRSAFWLRDEADPYPAVALEAGKSLVDGRPRLEQRGPARHRSARPRRGDSCGAPARRAGAGQRVRVAHAGRHRQGVQPALVPRRLGLAARHGDRAARARARRSPGRSP